LGKVDLEIQGVLRPHRNFFLELKSILILINEVIFGDDKIPREEQVALFLIDRNEAWALY
jgi:hypothetical protein